MPERKDNRKKIPGDISEDTEITGDAESGDLDFCTVKRDAAFGRGRPRVEPAPNRKKAAQRREQTRRFTEHSAKPVHDPANPTTSQTPDIQPHDAEVLRTEPASAQESAAAPVQIDIAQDFGNSRSYKPGKLKFTADESPPLSATAKSEEKQPNGKPEITQSESVRSAKNPDKVHKNPPKKHNPKIERTFDMVGEKPKRKLVFEDESKNQRAYMNDSTATRPIKTGANSAIAFGHKKIHEAEQENVGTHAAHKAERIVEGGLRRAYRLHKTTQYSKAAKLGNRTAKLNINHINKQSQRDSPKLKSNTHSRVAQRRKIKRQYAQETRDAQRAGRRIKQTGSILTRTIRGVVRLAARHPAVIGILAALFLLFSIIPALFTSCSNMATGVATTVLATSYLAMDADIDDAALIYSEWEVDLQIQIANAESDWPGFDEYRYYIDDISHNPFELMAFLTAVYQEFTFAEVEPILRQIFDEQYQLTFTPSVEIRTRIVTRIDPDTGEVYEATEEYEWHIMAVRLTARSFTNVIWPRMDGEQWQHYMLLMQSRGNRQYSASPVAFNWLPFVSSDYGWRIHPILGAKDRHMGVDIAMPIGTEILAGHDGTVSIGYDVDGYGHFITLTGADGLVTRYAHLDRFLVNNGQMVSVGDVIALSGNSGRSTGPHLHFEVIKKGRHLNPLFFALTNDDGSAPTYGIPGEALNDEQFALMWAEIQLRLGSPYVWGGSGPYVFDCSGFVSWVLNNSGIGINVGRQGATALYNLSTRIHPSELRPGDLVFFHSTYSTPRPVSHVGIYVGNGQMAHAGRPVNITSFETPFWQRHFFAFGRIVS